MYTIRFQESKDYNKEEIKKYWCTEYAQQRASEALGYKAKVAKDRDAGGYHNAQAWLQYSNYPTSDAPKPGSVACWGGGEYGHVAFVEDCYEKDNGYYHISVTQANQNSTFFTGEYDVKVGEYNQGIGTLQGFMILPVEDLRVCRNSCRLQVKVLADMLRVRKAPNGPNVSGLACPKGIYNCEIVEIDDVKWAKLAEDAYIMMNDEEGWTETYMPENNVEMRTVANQLTELAKQLANYEEDMERLKALDAELKCAKEEIKSLKEKIDKIKEILN